METHHEDAHRCSRLGHADCGAHLRPVRERGADVAGKLLVRGERLLRFGKLALLLPHPNPGLPGIWALLDLPEAGKPAAGWWRGGGGGGRRPLDRFRTIQVCPKDFTAARRDTAATAFNSEKRSSRRERKHGSSPGLFASKERRAPLLLRRGTADGWLRARRC